MYIFIKSCTHTIFIAYVAECLKLSLVSCDGGQKDENHRPDSMLSNQPNTSSSKLLVDFSVEALKEWLLNGSYCNSLL